MSFSKKPRTRAHLVVLCLCVGACMAAALLERPVALNTPGEGADSLFHSGMLHTMQAPTPPPSGQPTSS